MSDFTQDMLILAALLGSLGIVAIALRSPRQPADHQHTTCYHGVDCLETFRDHATQLARHDTKHAAHASDIAILEERLNDALNRLTIVERTPRTVTQIINHYYERLTRFDFAASIIGGIAGVLVGIITVAFLKDHTMTIAGTEFHFGLGIHQIPLDVITVALFALTFGAIAGFIWASPVDRPINAPSRTTTTNQP